MSLVSCDLYLFNHSDCSAPNIVHHGMAPPPTHAVVMHVLFPVTSLKLSDLVPVSMCPYAYA